MIAFISGVLSDITESSVIVDAGGIGFEILTYPGVIASLSDSIGTEVKIHTYMDVKEQDMCLYGFMDVSDKKLFQQLISVNGVGPKVALAILGAMPSERIISAINAGNPKILADAKGVGTKVAQRIVLELRGKVAGAVTELEAVADSTDSEVYGDAVAALRNLGFTAAEIKSAMKKIPDKANLDFEELIDAALKLL